MLEQFSVNTIEKDFSDSFDSLVKPIVCPKVLVAFSGGLDSLALLILCVNKLGKDNVFPVYVNHNIRDKEELENEIVLNRQNCKKLGLSLEVVNLDLNQFKTLEAVYGTEGAARKLRYEALEKNSKDYDFIVTAHHKDDQIETVVMKKLQNSPQTAFRGISQKWGKVIRPLLDFSKIELKNYVDFKGFCYSTDSTNSDNSYFRNYVRNIYIPQQRIINHNFDNEILELRQKAIEECDNFEWNGSSINLDYFRSLTHVKKTIVLFSMWDKLGLGQMSQKMVDRVINASEKSSSLESACESAFCIYDNVLYCVSKKEDSLYRNFETEVNEEMLIPGFEVKFTIDPFDFKAIHLRKDKLSSNAKIRFPRTEDYISLSSGTVGVQKLLKDMKVPFVFRSRTPVLVDCGRVVAVFASVWGKKDRVEATFKEKEWKCEPCFKFTCLF